MEVESLETHYRRMALGEGEGEGDLEELAGQLEVISSFVPLHDKIDRYVDPLDFSAGICFTGIMAQESNSSPQTDMKCFS